MLKLQFKTVKKTVTFTQFSLDNAIFNMKRYHIMLKYLQSIFFK